MKETQYVALLRGVNVGGKNLIKMTDLAACFEEQGFGDVKTYIQSGNILFTSRLSDSLKVARNIEKALAAKFNYQGRVSVLSRAELKKIVQSAPRGFGSSPTRFRYDVLFLMDSLSASEILKILPTKPGVDQVFAGPGALYFSRLISKASQSRLSKVVSMPVYQSMTIRNWNTTSTLLSMMGSRTDEGTTRKKVRGVVSRKK